ncbi:hypothetical protein C8Q78DRAFT_418664 [Trametes maxima]|nr:hypothetical protein C8Q78DRAFT_418664 [Trametes maxima]
MEPLEGLLNVLSIAWFALWVFRCLPLPVAVAQLALISVGTAISTYGTALRVCTVLTMFCILATRGQLTAPPRNRKRIWFLLVCKIVGSCLFFAWALSDIVYERIFELLSSCDVSAVAEAALIVRDWITTTVWNGLSLTITSGLPSLLWNVWGMLVVLRAVTIVLCRRVKALRPVLYRARSMLATPLRVEGSWSSYAASWLVVKFDAATSFAAGRFYDFFKSLSRVFAGGDRSTKLPYPSISATRTAFTTFLFPNKPTRIALDVRIPFQRVLQLPCSALPLPLGQNRSPLPMALSEVSRLFHNYRKRRKANTLRYQVAKRASGSM